MRSTYNFEGVYVMVQKDGDKIWFRGKNVAEALSYRNLGKAVTDHVKKKEIKKVKLEAISEGRWPERIITYMINVSGMYRLVFASRSVSRQERFTDWVTEVVLPSVMRAGWHTQPKPTRNRMSLIGETQLHYDVVKYIETHYPDAIIVPGLGENQDTKEKRIDSRRKGYKAGLPDIIVTEPYKKYAGLVIELKTSKGCGVTSEEQSELLYRLGVKGYYILLSHNYDEICRCVDGYMEDAGVMYMT